MFKKQNAFTLIELMVTLVVAAVVIGVAIPSFTTQILNNRSAALGEDFTTAVSFVKNEALKKRDGISWVSLCASSDGATCNGGSGDWRNGFIAVVDYAATATAAAPLLTDPTHATSTILRVWREQDINAVITITQGVNVSFFRFTKWGTLALVSNNPVIINSHLLKCTGNAKRKITVGIAGVVSVEKIVCP